MSKGNRKDITVLPDLKRELSKMAADSDKQLKPFIEELLAVVVEFKDFSSVKWLLKQVGKK